MDEILYARESSIGVDEFIEVLRQSGLGERRPLADTDRMERMIANANLIVTARKAGKLVGVSRDALLDLHRDGRVDDAVLHRIESELDFEELRLQRLLEP